MSGLDVTRTARPRSPSKTLRTDARGERLVDNGEDQVHRLRFNPQLTARALAAAVVLVVTTGALANYAVYNLAPHPDHPVADVLKRFDLGHEPSIPAFYSASVMLAAAALLAFLGRVDQSGGPTRRRYWPALSLLLLCLAVDEVVMFHEMATKALDVLQLGGGLYFSWILPGLACAAIVGLLFRRFLISLGRRTGTLLTLAGVVFIAGALGMELVAGRIFSATATELDALRSVSHVVVQAIEEGLEMAGMAMFLWALVDYARMTELDIVVRNTPSRQPVAGE